ncbi:polyhydroxyalkanoate depolymerase [Methylobrevis albus]|uniref:Polyhydroxyalkanoate depolymerase n=1 Tax=Methylobrevis albus TaxID=2793297 RepID=A0A931MY93_9HYPH|nr:polyhydroxyalkanoate depolymerase [Methylobrevis albus]MBH0237760.1 polyhydroxyalkanoate depolymerase [Methylobrevis albus]
MTHVPYYQLYELNHAAVGPVRAAADLTRLYFQNPFNPLAHTDYGRKIAAACELFERGTRRYDKPAFNLPTTLVGGERVAVTETVVWERPFCRLIHFERALGKAARRADPKVLVVAPMSGHYATLLRGTVEALLPRHEVYITDWTDARMVPLIDGRFDLDDYIDYVAAMVRALGGDVHVLGVCQPSVPVLAAVAVMNAAGDEMAPLSMTLMGGPIDTRRNPTAVNRLAEERGTDWFANNVIMKVPFPNPGVLRDVYPGFLQLTGFMSMNLDRHLGAHKDFFKHLVTGDGDSATKHREFYDEYLAVMDLTAEFYLQTVDEVFVRHSMARGVFTHRGETVDCGAITRTALLTIEGEKDDITGRGQTQAAHDLCTNLPDDMKAHYEQPAVGHYGVFNGSRWRAEICPRIADFILTHNRRPSAAAAKAADVKPATAKAPAAKPATAKARVLQAENPVPRRRSRAKPTT